MWHFRVYCEYLISLNLIRKSPVSTVFLKCLDNGLDFIDNDNINFKHLGRDGLHINKDGQRRLAGNFINHIKSYRNVTVCDEVTICIGNSESEHKATQKLGFKKGMVVASLNILGLNTHIDELRLFIREKGIRVLGINETKLGETFPIILFLLMFSKLYERTMTNLGVGLPYIFTIQSILKS